MHPQTRYMCNEILSQNWKLKKYIFCAILNNSKTKIDVEKFF